MNRLPISAFFRVFAVLLLVAGCVTADPEPELPTEVNVTGTLHLPSLDGGAAPRNEDLTIHALGTNRGVRVYPVAADGSFVLRMPTNASYTLNVLDRISNEYIGSFLFRMGSQTSVALTLQASDLDLRNCTLQEGEVWCENGFFDDPVAAGSVVPGVGLHGKRTLTIEGTDAGSQVLRSLIGGDSAAYEVVPNPDRPFHAAIWNTSLSGCDLPMVGTFEAVGNEHYFYTENEYENPTCRAQARFQGSCTMDPATDVCSGFMRVDITSSGTDCAAWPPIHASTPARSEPSTDTTMTCTLPQTCESDDECATGVCLGDVGFCQLAERSPELSLWTFDVGNGSASLLVAPNGRSIFIDGGRPNSGRLIASLIRRLVNRIDYMIPSHYDADHAGGVRAVIIGPDGAPGRRGVNDDGVGAVDDDLEAGWAGSDDLLPVAALDRGAAPGNATYDPYASLLGARRRAAVPGEILDLGVPGLTVTVVSADGRIAGGQSFSPTEENDRSVGLLVQYGQFSMMTLGDTPGTGSRAMEQAIAASAPVQAALPIDVQVLSHHGSADSSSANFLSAIQPKVALISIGDSDTCGAGFNSYGLPAQSVLDNLASSTTIEAVYQTQWGGASFAGGCNPEANQTYPRNYGDVPATAAYSTFGVHATETSFRVTGLYFDDHFLAE